MKLSTPGGKIRLGLIGASNIANRILPSIRSVPEIEVVAVAAKRPGRAEELSRTHDIGKSYSTYEECLEDPNIDAVYISVINSDHAEWIQKSLEAGKHVLCEKPLTPTPWDTERAFADARDKKLILLEGLMYRLHPQIIKLKEIIAAGKVGEIHSIRTNFSFILYDLEDSDRPKRAHSTACGGALYDVGCYGVDFIHSLVAADKTWPNPIVSASQRTLKNDRFFDVATSVLLQFRGMTAVLECSVDTPSLNNWEVSGSKGSVAALRFDPQGTSPVPLYYVNENSEAELIKCPAEDTFRAEFQNFARSILGVENPHIEPMESIRNAQLISDIREKIKELQR